MLSVPALVEGAMGNGSGSADRQRRLAERTSQLAEAIEAEFLTRSQDPNAVFEPDWPALKLRARIKDDPAGGEWYTLTLTEDELLSGDLAKIARRFVDGYRAAYHGQL